MNLIHQPAKQRYVAHLLYAPTLQRGRALVVDDIVPLRNVPVSLLVRETVRRACLAPGRRPLRIARRAGRVCVTVPTVECHQMVVFDYGMA